MRPQLFITTAFGMCIYECIHENDFVHIHKLNHIISQLLLDTAMINGCQEIWLWFLLSMQRRNSMADTTVFPPEHPSFWQDQDENGLGLSSLVKEGQFHIRHGWVSQARRGDMRPDGKGGDINKGVARPRHHCRSRLIISFLYQEAHKRKCAYVNVCTHIHCTCTCTVRCVHHGMKYYNHAFKIFVILEKKMKVNSMYWCVNGKFVPNTCASFMKSTQVETVTCAAHWWQRVIDKHGVQICI